MPYPHFLPPRTAALHPCPCIHKLGLSCPSWYILLPGLHCPMLVAHFGPLNGCVHTPPHLLPWSIFSCQPRCLSPGSVTHRAGLWPPHYTFAMGTGEFRLAVRVKFIVDWREPQKTEGPNAISLFLPRRRRWFTSCPFLTITALENSAMGSSSP